MCGDHKDKGWTEAALWGVQSPSHPVLCPCLHLHSSSLRSAERPTARHSLAQSVPPRRVLGAARPHCSGLWRLPHLLWTSGSCLVLLGPFPGLSLSFSGWESLPPRPRPLPRAPASTASSSCFHPHTPYLGTRPFPGPETHRPGAKGHPHWLHSLQKNVYRPRACLWDRNAVTPTFSP